MYIYESNILMYNQIIVCFNLYLLISPILHYIYKIKIKIIIIYIFFISLTLIFFVKLGYCDEFAISIQFLHFYKNM